MKWSKYVFASLVLSLASFSIGFAGGFSFTDVEDGAWYADSLIRLENLGILQGYSDNTFRGENPLTRAEITVILTRFMDQVVGPVAAGAACSASYFNPEDYTVYMPGETFTVLDTYMCENGEWVVYEQ